MTEPSLFDATEAAAPVEAVEYVDRHTERHLLDLLRAKYERDYGNGPRYVFATHVRNRASFQASRTFDAVAVDLWRSSGLLVHIFEVKVSRSDWLRELADPSKADAAMACGDTFSVVAPSGIVGRDELRSTWGLYELHRPGHLITSRAPQVHSFPPAKKGQPYADLPRDFVIPLLRAAVRTARNTMGEDA